jgi:hypothetical protein
LLAQLTAGLSKLARADGPRAQNTSPAAGPGGSGSLQDGALPSVGQGLDLYCTHRAGSFTESVVAEIDDVAAGKRASGLLQPAAGCETAQVDRRKTEALDHTLDEIDRL